MADVKNTASQAGCACGDKVTNKEAASTIKPQMKPESPAKVQPGKEAKPTGQSGVHAGKEANPALKNIRS